MPHTSLPTIKTLTLSLAILIAGSSNAFIEEIDLDLGSEKTYKKLLVTAKLLLQPYESTEGIMSKEILERHYTNSNARLHCKTDRSASKVSAGGYEADIELVSTMLQNNSTQVVVNYALNERPWLPLLFSPTQIESKSIVVTIDGDKHTAEHHNRYKDLVRLVIAATWKNYSDHA